MAANTTNAKPLESWLWDAACSIRGAQAKLKYKDFILPLVFAKGEDVTDFLDMSTIRRPQQQLKRANVDFPVWMIERLDREAKHLGVTRQSIIMRLEKLAPAQILELELATAVPVVYEVDTSRAIAGKRILANESLQPECHEKSEH